MELIDKDALVAEIEKRIKEYKSMKIDSSYYDGMIASLEFLHDEFIDTLEVIDPYITCIQYTNREAAIKTHAEDYSWNIESELFQQLTTEQQKIWRKEIEQAVISGGYCGLNLEKDPRYKKNLEVKEVDLEKEIDKWWWGKTWQVYGMVLNSYNIMDFAKHFFELGMQVSNKAQKGE